MRTVAGVLVVAAVMGLFTAGAILAAQEGAASGQGSPAIVDVGNTICPLTGEEVDGKTFYVYKGRRYGVCCPQCAENFAQDPATYAAIAEKQARAARTEK